ncbi:MAG: hypothetical protein ABI467_07095 [Kofleriaceae bacterium]
MRLSLVWFAVIAAGCGQQIGDSCIVSSDCAIDGSRVCDNSQQDGYCTMQGCDYDTCPGESVCVRFFSGGFTNKPCGAQADCSLDELCSLEALCVPRSAETRFCMKKCDQKSDCRDGYECRDYDLMKVHGGEPVLAPGDVVDQATAPAFCAIAPVPVPAT